MAEVNVHEMTPDELLQLLEDIAENVKKTGAVYPYVIFDHHSTLYQYYLKHHVDKDNELTDDEWEDYVKGVQNGFCMETREFAEESFRYFVDDLDKGHFDEEDEEDESQED
jgi:hypothetical protein